MSVDAAMGWRIEELPRQNNPETDDYPELESLLSKPGNEGWVIAIFGLFTRQAKFFGQKSDLLRVDLAASTSWCIRLGHNERHTPVGQCPKRGKGKFSATKKNCLHCSRGLIV